MPVITPNRFKETKIDKLRVLKTAVTIQLTVQFQNLSYIYPLLTQIADNDDGGTSILIDQICKNQQQKSDIEKLIHNNNVTSDASEIDEVEQELHFFTYLKRLVLREITAMQSLPHLSAISYQLENEVSSI